MDDLGLCNDKVNRVLARAVWVCKHFQKSAVFEITCRTEIYRSLPNIRSVYDVDLVWKYKVYLCALGIVIINAKNRYTILKP